MVTTFVATYKGTKLYDEKKKKKKKKRNESMKKRRKRKHNKWKKENYPSELQNKNTFGLNSKNMTK